MKRKKGVNTHPYFKLTKKTNQEIVILRVEKCGFHSNSSRDQ